MHAAPDNDCSHYQLLCQDGIKAADFGRADIDVASCRPGHHGGATAWADDLQGDREGSRKKSHFSIDLKSRLSIVPTRD